MSSAQTQNIIIRLSSFDHKDLDRLVKMLLNHIRMVGGVVAGPIPLPLKIEKVTVNRSPHCNKKSQESFETRKSKRIIIIKHPSSEVTQALSEFNLPSGIDAEIKVAE